MSIATKISLISRPRAAALAAAVACAACAASGSATGGADARRNADAPADTVDAPAGAIDAPIAAADAPPGTPDGAAAVDPAMPGPYGVHVDDGGSVATPKGNETITVYAPSSDGGATIAPGAFPLVVVSPGFSIGRAAYANTCRHLATWGYVVLIHDYASGNHQDHAAGVVAIVTWVLGASSGLATHVDPAAIATAGHSMGGKVSILAAILDPRIKAVVGWDPVDALPPIADGSYSVTPEKMSGLKVPLALLGETTDGSGGLGTPCAPADDNYHQFFTHACDAPAALEVTIGGADHTQWTDSSQACGLACLVCTAGNTPAATVSTITRRVTVAWLETYLRGKTGLDVWWTAPAIGTPTTVSTQTGC